MDALTGPALTPEELGALQDRLVGAMQDAGSMPLDFAHGLFSATAAAGLGAERLAALLDRVLGELAGETDLRELLARFREQLLLDLASADYGPLLVQLPREDGSSLPLPYGWCQGYAAGLEFLGEAQRERLLGDEQSAALLAPVLSFLMYEEAQWFDPPNEAAHRETVGELGDAALGLYQWWLAQPRAL